MDNPPILKALETSKIGPGAFAFYLIPKFPDEPIFFAGQGEVPGAAIPERVLMSETISREQDADSTNGGQEKGLHGGAINFTRSR